MTLKSTLAKHNSPSMLQVLKSNLAMVLYFFLIAPPPKTIKLPLKATIAYLAKAFSALKVENTVKSIENLKYMHENLSRCNHHQPKGYCSTEVHSFVSVSRSSVLTFLYSKSPTARIFAKIELVIVVCYRSMKIYFPSYYSFCSKKGV